MHNLVNSAIIALGGSTLVKEKKMKPSLKISRLLKKKYALLAFHKHQKYVELDKGWSETEGYLQHGSLNLILLGKARPIRIFFTNGFVCLLPIENCFSNDQIMNETFIERNVSKHIFNISPNTN